MLFRRGKTYYYRVWIPQDLREHFGGRSDIKKSLKTQDARTAKAAAAEFASSLQSLYMGIRLGMLSQEDINRIKSRIIGEVVEDLRSGSDFFGNDGVPMTEYGPRLMRYGLEPQEVLDAIASQEKLDPEFVRNVRASALSIEKKLRANVLHPSVRTRAKNVINELGLSVNAPVLDYSSAEEIPLPDNRISPHFIDICTLVAKTAAEVVLHEYGKTLGHNSDNSVQKISEQFKGGLADPRLSELWASYCDEKITKGLWRDNTATKNQDAFRVIMDIIGDPKVPECGSQTRADLIKGLLAYPKNKNKYREFRDKPFSFEMAKMERFQPISIEHANFHIELLSSVFRYAKEDARRWRTDQNPFENQQLDESLRGKRKPNEKKRPFTMEEVSGIYVELSKVRRKFEPEKFWPPLICLHSGMRANESCQLRTCNIEEIGGVPVFQILHRPERHQETKNGEDRTVPIHKNLIVLGFLDYVEAQKKKGEDRVFSNLTLSEDGKWHDSVCNWFNRTVLKSHLKVPAPATFHSTKHTFINFFKQRRSLSWSDVDKLKYIVAHLEDDNLQSQWTRSTGITTTIYGADYELQALRDFINELDYGVDLGLLEKKSRY